MLLPRKRRCTKCGEFKPCIAEYWHKDKVKKWGFSTQCKVCRCKNSKKWLQENTEKRKEYITKYNEEHREELREKSRQYNKENKEKKRESDRRYYRENKEKIKEYKKEWRKNNPEKLFNGSNRRRSKENNQGNGITKEQWQEMMEFFDWKCAYSGEYLGGNCKERSIDHITPLDKGGENEAWNCVPMILTYNKSKFANDMLEWYQKQNFYSEERLNKIYQWQEYAKNKWMK